MKKVRLLALAVLLISLLTVNVFAAGWQPSVENQEAPTVSNVVVTDKDGNSVVIDDENVVVTPYSKRDSASSEGISEALSSAMDDIQKVDSLADLASEDGTIAQDLQNALAGTGYSVEDLVISDLFDVSIVGVDIANGTVTMTFQTTVRSGDVLIVLHNYATGKWEVVDPSLVKINDDGTVTVTLNSLSPIAFTTAANKSAPAQPAADDALVTSPQTGETVNLYVVMAAAMMLVAACCCMIRAKRATR